MARWVVFGILLMFTGTFMEPLSMNPMICRFGEDKLCYAAMGRRLELKFPEGIMFMLKKNESSGVRVILRYRAGDGDTADVRIPGWTFVTGNSTVIINSANKSDSGTYILETTVTGGKIETANLQLIVEVPVSSVDVSYSCVTPTRTVSCAAQGDDLQFHWTSPSQTLDERNRELPLDEPEVTNVTCHVENHVSSESKTIELQKCSESTILPTTSPATTAVDKQTWPHNEMILIILVSITLVLFTVSIIACVMYKRRLAAKSKGSSQATCELVYAQVTHTPNSGAKTRLNKVPVQEENVEYATVAARRSQRKTKQKTDEVQYGELVFNTTASPEGVAKQPEECVYSQIRQAR